jgi:hypothetical protein
MFLGGMCLAAAALYGCQSNEKPRHAAREDGIFMPDPSAHQLWTILEAQSITGAQADAMLYAHHFDGDRLNSLGAQKLEMMLDGSARPAAVYLDLAHGDSRAAARHASVEQWLRDAGVAADAVAVKDGPNPDAAAPAGDGLSRMSKTESPRARGTSSGGSNGSSSFQPQGMSPNSTGGGNSY